MQKIVPTSYLKSYKWFNYKAPSSFLIYCDIIINLKAHLKDFKEFCQRGHGGILKQNKQWCFTMSYPRLKPQKDFCKGWSRCYYLNNVQQLLKEKNFPANSTTRHLPAAFTWAGRPKLKPPIKDKRLSNGVGLINKVIPFHK